MSTGRYTSTRGQVHSLTFDQGSRGQVHSLTFDQGHPYFTGWLGWAMVLGSFQCRGVLLLLHIVGQGPAIVGQGLAAGAGRVGYIFLYFSSIFPF